MSNSVVKVTDSTLNDSLLLLVGEDGTVTPSKDVVQAYLNGKSDPTNLQIMHVDKSDNNSIEVTVKNMLYLPDAEENELESEFDEVAYNWYNVKLDHDYTPHRKPLEEVDELAKTLSILDGDEEIEPVRHAKSELKGVVHRVGIKDANVKSKVRLINTHLKQIPKGSHTKKIKLKSEEESDNNADGEWDEGRQRRIKKVVKSEVRSKEGAVVKSPKGVKIEEEKAPKPVVKIESPPQSSQSVITDKKTVKKEKKPTKPVPDDFALFSTPDIIRRVGNKEAGAFPSTSELGSPESRPAKIEIRSKSASESPQSPAKYNRLSLDGKVGDKAPVKVDNKPKDVPLTPPEPKIKRIPDSTPKKMELTAVKSGFGMEGGSLGQIAADDINSIMMTDENKSFANSLSLEGQDLSGNENNMTLDGNGLDLDPTLLENINNDLISEDILYQVAQSLVSNTELQNAIDKSLNEGNLVLDSTVPDVLERKQDNAIADETIEQVSSSVPQKSGTQIVRPDGRIVVIPPIERPTTRSRNRRRDLEKPSNKFVRKPLDDEHVSGNELDSSGEEEEEEEEAEEEESEDDPNKLWCICNQPHNNRFMICCDTCEEWYHGKCVNITKAMGQQMELEGREWICLFCKDPQLRRPQAAARRIRKASRNSRQSSDSAGSTKLEISSSSVPCVVCQKPSRNNSIFCSEACILLQAQGVERVVVFERATGNMLTGSKAPSAANLEQWLKEHPGYEVVRSAGKIVTTKQTHNISPTKLKLLKNFDTESVPVGPRKSPGGLRIIPKIPPQLMKPSPKRNITGIKVVSKQIVTPPNKEKVSTPTKDSPTSSMPAKPKILSPTVKPSTPTLVHKDRPKVQRARSEQGTPNKQENIRENVQKTVFEQLTNRLKLVDDLKLTEDELKNISTEIESQLYKCFGDTGQKYRNKYRSLIFNIKDIKNQTLWRRICEKSINPYQLVRLSPDDMASQELALWREREAKHQLDMIKKSELELLNCNRQYVLKTHKGEEVLEDNRPTDHIDNTEVITSLTDSDKAERKRDTSRDNDRKNSKHSHKDKDRKSSKEKSDAKISHGHRSLSREDRNSRKRSRSRDKGAKHGEKRRSRSRGRDRHRKSSHKSSRHKKESHRGSSTEKLDKKSKEILEQLVDSKIVPPLEDRLWKHVPQEDIIPTPVAESDSDHEPTSTVTIPTPPRNNDGDEFVASQSAVTENKNDKPTKERVDAEVPVPGAKLKSEEIWRGVINMIDVAQISITAHEVSGDCNGLTTELPQNLDIVGRISPDTVWDYIGKMKCSNSKVISIVRLNAINVEEKMPYLALYSYLSSRNRLGVVKSTNKAVKDFYVLPLASQKPIPQALLPLNGPGFEESRPALLLGILVRDKRKRPYLDIGSSVVPKKPKTEAPPLSQPARSYTPPPVKESKHKLPLPPSVDDQDGDEPYSPEDSDPDSIIPSTTGIPSNPTSFLETDVATAQTFQPFVNKFSDIPGLDNPTLPSSTKEIQRQMEKLNKEIEMQKSEINSISQNIATASTEIRSSALANIALPSNLQEILDSIKTIESTPTGDVPDAKAEAPVQENLTIPLMLPTSFSRHAVSSSSESFSENTIPLNLPGKKKGASDVDKTNSVLSSLSEEDLIRKAEEMLGDSKTKPPPPKLSKVEMAQPPVPGLEDEIV